MCIKRRMTYSLLWQSPFPFYFLIFLEEISSYFLELLWVLCSSRSHMILCDVAEVLSFPVASVGRGSLSCWLMFSVDDSLLTVLSHGVFLSYISAGVVLLSFILSFPALSYHMSQCPTVPITPATVLASQESWDYQETTPYMLRVASIVLLSQEPRLGDLLSQSYKCCLNLLSDNKEVCCFCSIY